MEGIRKRYPRHIPCLVHTPEGKKLKLLVAKDATTGFINGVCRQRLDTGSSSTAYFLIHGRSMCTGSTRVSSLDINAPAAVELHLTCENTFG